jgi:YVTN family beta-propeller protein
MRRILVVAALFAAVAFGQVVEKTLYLPDSSGGMLEPWCLAYSSTSNRVYVGSYDEQCVIVIDAATRQKVARIPLARDIVNLCYNSENNKVYGAPDGGSSVIVIECGRAADPAICATTRRKIGSTAPTSAATA